MLLEYAEDGNLAEVKKLLERDVTVVMQKDGKGWTAAHYAALQGNLEVLKHLHTVDASILSAVAPNGQNPAHFAAKFCKRNRVMLQWIMSIEQSALNVPDKLGRTALTMIAKDLEKSSEGVLAWLGCDENDHQKLAAAPPSNQVSTPPQDTPISAFHPATPTRGPPEEPKFHGARASLMEASPPAHSTPPPPPNAGWAEELEQIRHALVSVFGPNAGRSMMDQWDLTAERVELHSLDHSTGDGKPMGYAELSAQDRTAIDKLLVANTEMNADNMEMALEKFARDSTWEHRDVYVALALAESEEDSDITHVRETLVQYAERLAPSGAWDPAVLLSAARAQTMQANGSKEVKQILLALYRTLFLPQAEAMMSVKDKDFLDNFGADDFLFALSRENSRKKTDCAEMWRDFKEREGIQSQAMDELMQLVGIRLVKEQALAIIKKLLADSKLTEKQRVVTTCNFTFMGNPGTGKTSVARIFANILHEIGLREGNNFIETTGQQLVQDGAIKADGVINKAMNGVLFIDEAHSLDPKMNKAEGAAIVTKLLKAAEDSRDKLTIILAGYQDEIEDKLYAADQGFRSRFEDVTFADFSESELRKIFVDMVKSKTWSFDPEDPQLVEVVTARLVRGSGRKGFANARTVRSTLERAIKKASLAERGAVLKIEDFLGPRPDPKRIPELRDALKVLEDMTGLDEEQASDGSTKTRGLPPKKAVRQLVKTAQANYDRELAGQKPLQLTLNRLFLGSPGTGKTTVAGIYGRILKHLGLLSNGNEVITVAAKFIVGHEGGTQEATMGILNSAVGKVLVIDEAYVFNTNTYGKEAIDTIVSQVMGSPGEDRAVLMLGYEDKMLKMLNDQNQGLRRRFNPEDAFYFADFDDGALLSVLRGELKRQELSMDRSVRSKFIGLLASERKKGNFGNAGAVKNLLSKSFQAMSVRDPRTRQIIDEDLGESARDAAAGGDPLDELKGMFMIEPIVEQLRELSADIEYKRSQGKDIEVQNFLFLGNPGTGKTKVARIMGKMMSRLGLLEDKPVVETTALEVQGEYIGHSQGKAREKMEAAAGGVLFLDEAHNLGNSPFAIEAAKVFMTATLEEKHQGRTMIIFAGYEEHMYSMMQAVDPGFRRRFKQTIIFPDWSPENCVDFVRVLCKEQDISLSDEAAEHLLEQLTIIHKRPGWGNASDAHDTFNYLERALALRMKSSPDRKDSRVITIADARHAMTKFHSNRPDRVDTEPMAGQVVVGAKSHSGPRPVKRVEMVTEKREDSEEAEAAEEASPGEDEDIFAALQLACRELGYDEDQEMRKKLIGILDSVVGGVSSFTQDILDHVKEKTGQNETKLNRILRPQVPPFLKAMSEAVAAEEERLAEIKKLEEQKKLEEAENLRRKHAAMQKKLRTMGRCPMGYGWYRCNGGWRCHGGTHWVSNVDLE